MSVWAGEARREDGTQREREGERRGTKTRCESEEGEQHWSAMSQSQNFNSIYVALHSLDILMRLTSRHLLSGLTCLNTSGWDKLEAVKKERPSRESREVQKEGTKERERAKGVCSDGGMQLAVGRCWSVWKESGISCLPVVSL